MAALVALLVAFVVSSSLCTVVAAADRQPNLVFIMADGALPAPPGIPPAAGDAHPCMHHAARPCAS